MEPRGESAVLRCEECGRDAVGRDENAHGWRTVLAGGVEDEPKEVVVLCPECAEREFGVGDE